MDILIGLIVLGVLIMLAMWLGSIAIGVLFMIPTMIFMGIGWVFEKIKKLL